MFSIWGFSSLRCGCLLVVLIEVTVATWQLTIHHADD